MALRARPAGRTPPSRKTRLPETGGTVVPGLGPPLRREDGATADTPDVATRDAEGETLPLGLRGPDVQTEADADALGRRRHNAHARPIQGGVPEAQARIRHTKGVPGRLASGTGVAVGGRQDADKVQVGGLAETEALRLGLADHAAVGGEGVAVDDDATGETGDTPVTAARAGVPPTVPLVGRLVGAFRLASAPFRRPTATGTPEGREPARPKERPDEVTSVLRPVRVGVETVAVPVATVAGLYTGGLAANRPVACGTLVVVGPVPVGLGPPPVG